MNEKKNLTEYRPVNQKHIEILKKNGCSAENWETVFVKEGFQAELVSAVSFFSSVYIGRLGKTIISSCGKKRISSLSGAALENVYMEDDVYIHGYGSTIQNYILEREVILENVKEVCTPEPSSFGSGVIIEAVNEKGGRDIPIFNELNAHTAYMFAMYRHDKRLISEMERLAELEKEKNSSDMGVISHNASIFHTGKLHSVCVGPYAVIEGASSFSNGTILSSEIMPVRIGSSVFAEDFIIQEGVSIGFGVSLIRAFIGQGVKIDTQFSAIDSLAFAGSELAHGEIASVFAGPFSVSHHKGTLLIASYMSFFNAGSGTNQSNHMYKLGPTSQGVLERGCKTASNVYLRWPKRIGAGTIVIGSHIVAFDTHDFPFSYLVEMDEKSVLIPGRNITSIGIVRDTNKWLQRDPREGENLRDYINFSLYNPLSMQSMFRGQQRLQAIKMHRDVDQYPITGFYLRQKDIQKGVDLYELLLRAYLGRIVVRKLEMLLDEPKKRGVRLSFDEIITGLIPKEEYNSSENWADLSGLLIPENQLNDLIDQIKSNTYASFEHINTALHKIFLGYEDYEYSWVLNHLQKKKHKSTAEFSEEDLFGVLRQWIEAEKRLYRLRRTDAYKEYSELAKISYGIDGNDDVRNDDFEAIHGKFDGNKAIVLLDKDIQNKEKTFEKMIELLENLEE
ncbi:MAG: DUF4954 family protein [Spirochaetia bacterium]|nr:DUF4954 family protein [Spirochaetia bacterium]MCF7946386.1 DUF4954 family protein [Spirochaetia bacterium]